MEIVFWIQRENLNFLHTTHMHRCIALLMLSIWSHRISIIPLVVIFMMPFYICPHKVKYNEAIDLFHHTSLKIKKKSKKSYSLSWVWSCSQSMREEKALYHKVRSLTHPVLLIAPDLQIICIDQSRDHTECRADSKILSI